MKNFFKKLKKDINFILNYILNKLIKYLSYLKKIFVKTLFHILIIKK